MGSEMRRQKTKPNQTFITNGYLVWMLAGAQTNHGGSSMHAHGFPAKMGEQMIVTS